MTDGSGMPGDNRGMDSNSMRISGGNNPSNSSRNSAGDDDFGSIRNRGSVDNPARINVSSSDDSGGGVRGNGGNGGNVGSGGNGGNSGNVGNGANPGNPGNRGNGGTRGNNTGGRNGGNGRNVNTPNNRVNGNPSARGSGGGMFAKLIGAFSIGAIIGRLTGRGGNNGNSSNGSGGSGRGNKKLFSVLGFVLAILVLYGVFYPEKIPFVYDRSPEENLNLFLVNVENSSKYPYKERKSGNPVYDTNRIKYNQIYDMGSPHYFVYIYSGDEKRDRAFNKAVTAYEKRKDSVPVYRLKYIDVINSDDDRLMLSDSQILELYRFDQKAEILYKYRKVDDWKEVWGDVKK